LFLARFIAKLGLTGDAHTKRIPPWVFRLPKLQRLALIAGVIDADGYVNEKGRFEISLCNKPLIQDLIHVATLSGLNTSKIYERISYGFATRPAKVPFVEYKIVIPCKPEIPVRNSKHKQRLRKGFVRLGVEESKWAQRRYPFLGFVRVHSIQKVGKEPVYDVAIEGSHNFVANCFLVHNSKGYSENLIRMAEDLAKSWVAKLSETFAPPDVREAVVRHMMPKGLEVADRWLATIGAAVMASKSPV
jgi:intein/homing endonuclease